MKFILYKKMENKKVIELLTRIIKLLYVNRKNIHLSIMLCEVI